MLPVDWRVALDPSVRRIDDGLVLVGGFPLRLLRLTPTGARLLDALDGGAPVPQTATAQQLVRRLLDAGIVHPRPGATSLARSNVTVVIPARDRAPALAGVDGVARVVVVDDGSRDPRLVATAAERGAVVVRHPSSRGPGAARNTGLQHVETDLVAFVDADCEPSDGWLEELLPHFGDDAVVAVAPRITTTIPSSLPGGLQRYESARPALDRGEREAIVRPRSPVPFVPTAALVARRRVLDEVGGFDERLRFGEDVDLVWRLIAAGGTVRYEPRATVAHAARATAGAWVRQRFDYGTSAAPLAQRHGTAVAPLAVSPWSAAVWSLAGLGQPAAGAAVAAGTTGLLAPRLKGLQHPWREAVQLAGKGHLYAGAALADAVRRSWWPLALAAAVGSRRARVGVAAAATVPALVEWRARRPGLGPVRWTALRLLDDVAYGAGVWAGCIRERSWRALRPDLTSWPGRRPPVEPT
ncbi:MAG TPA: mycofactocin biosynthesis glycosyltransferase MftF [Acidimicrobiales bacterium]|jgi:mycofactocin system glycosyltransferase|nr:mycofactocin biosynthesis glycosyltransferase MftF [Acidimicrobiales bacterium]